jgi:hypothetical protein
VERTAAASEDDIRQLAYRLWEADGRPDGRQEEYWFAAEAQFRKAPDEDRLDVYSPSPGDTETEGRDSDIAAGPGSPGAAA